MLTKESSKEEISQRTRAIRQALGLTQEQFAAKLGVTFPTINRWENNKVRPSPLALKQLEKLETSLKKRGVHIVEAAPEENLSEDV